jgi:hypothetical protein
MGRTPTEEARMAGPTQVTVDITATSNVCNTYNDPPTLPQITLDGTPLQAPGNKPPTASGWQLVVIDSSKDMTDPSSIIFNSYVGLYPDNNGFWYDTYGYMYDHIGRFLLASGSPDDQLLFLATYNMDQNAPPSAFFLELLMSKGAGKMLQGWSLTTDAGSENGWCSFPTAYALIGGGSYQYGLGHEAYGAPGASTATAQLSVTLGNP